MSGSTIGGVIGGAIGFFVGGPAGAQWGFMLGSMVGGYVDPDVIEGPRLKDAQGITASEGMPRPFGYGTFVCGGNIIQAGPLNEHVKKKRGKGGPVQKTYTYTRTYAIRICEGPIIGIARIWRNDKLVYSTRDGDTIPTETRKFSQKVRIYLGDETQLPDPSLESLPAANGGGVGNVPSYRGTCYAVFTEDDLTEMQGAIPQYRFEVVATGTTTEVMPEIVASATTTGGSAANIGAGMFYRTIQTKTVGAISRFTVSGGIAGNHESPARLHVKVAGKVVFDSGWITATPMDATQFDAWKSLFPSGEVLSMINSLGGSTSTNYVTGTATFPAGTTEATFECMFFNPTSTTNSSVSYEVEYPNQTVIGEYSVLPDLADGLLKSDGTVAFPEWATPTPITRVTPGMSSCAAIVSDLCARVGIPAANIDATALTQPVRGYMVGKQMEAGAAIRALQQGFFFDFPEFDGKLRGILRGGPVVMDVPEDHFIWSDEEKDETVRGQALEFPRKVNLVAPDPAANYEPAKQTATRRTSDKRAVSEMTSEVPIVYTRDENMQVADKMLKVAWDEATGRRTIQLPEQYSALVPSDPITVAGRRYRVDKREEAHGVLTLDITRDRASSYASTAKGSAGVDPTPPVSSTRGPTVFAIMQIPPLRDTDGVGVYVAGAGIMPGWLGYDLEISLDNGATYESAMTVTDGATLGRLTTVAGDPMGVKMQAGALDSVTADQIAAGANAIVLGGTEVAQFTDADLAAPNEYNLSGIVRGLKDTPIVAHPIGSQIVLLDGAVRFIAIDRSFAGKTIYLRPVSLGTAPENNQAYSFVYQPVIVVPPELQQITPIYNADGAAMTLDDGTIIYGRLT